MSDPIDDECTEPGEINPAKEFVLMLCTGPNDGVCKVNWDGNIGYLTEEMALAATKESVDEAGGAYMLYRCVPFKHIYRGATRVVAYKSKPR